MIVTIRRSFALAAILVLAGCTSSAPSAGPASTAATSAAPTIAASASPSTPGPSAPGTQSPASAAASSLSSGSPPSSAVACAALPQTVALPSDRFVDLKVVPGAAADRLTFVFGNASLPGPSAPAQGTLAVARPPFSQASSGASIRVAGEHVVQVRFTNMSLANDVGQQTYPGPTDVRSDAVAFQQAVQFDASEGVVGWYVGYDGSGCASLVTDAQGVTLVITHR